MVCSISLYCFVVNFENILVVPSRQIPVQSYLPTDQIVTVNVVLNTFIVNNENTGATLTDVD